jgi:PAS domain S-box-containing protein
MNATAATDEMLRAENAALRARLEDAEEMLRAIRAGEVDALVVETSAGSQLFTLQGVEAEQNRMRGEMLAQVSDAVIAIDLDDKVTYINASAERQWGVRASDVLGHALADIYIEQWSNPAAEAAKRTAMRERGECRCELIHRMHDGPELQVEKSISTLRASDGTPVGYVMAIRDVTFRVKVEREKAETLRLLDTLLTHAPVGFLFLDRDLRFVRINERLAEMNGISMAAHLGRPVAEILPMLEATLREVTTRILATGQPVLDQEFNGETPSTPGITRCWNESWYPVRDEGGEILGFGGVVEEITHRKQAEAALRLLNDRFELAVKCSRAVLWQQDLELQFTWLHNSTRGIIGTDAVGKRDEDLLERAEDAAVIVASKREVIRSGVGLRREFSPQIQGTRRCFEVLMEPLRDATGLITGLTGAAIDISDRKLAEEERYENERQYRALTEASSEFAYRMSADWSTLLPLDGRQLNPSSEQPLANWEWMHQNLPLDEHSRVRQAIREAIAGKTLFEMEHRVWRADGSIGWTFSRAVPILDKHQDVIAWFGAASDITDRKKIEEKLRESESRFSVALKNSPILVYTTDADLRYTWIHNPHPAFQSVAVLGLRDDELLSPEQAAPLIAIKREVFDSGVGRRAECAVEINGEQAIYDLTAEPLRGEMGSIIGVTVAAMEITDRKREETALKVSEVRYRRLFESAKDGILILDAHAATITDANPFMAEMLGYSQNEFVGKELWQIGLFKDVEASKAAMLELQEKGYIRYEDLPLETKAGRRINVEFVSNVYGEGGEAVIQCNIRDISDRKRLEESLRQHAADLSETDRRKDEFLATLAHELRNPLAPIHNGLQILKLPQVDAGTAEKARFMMEQQLEQMTRLIDDLMDVSRINQGKIQLQKTRMSLADAVQNAIETSRTLIDVQGHELVVNMPPESIYLDGDFTRLSQVFANLLNNAAKYTEQGGRIVLTVERHESDAVVSVADNGVGIRGDMLAHVFDMFAQIDGSLEKSQGGLGIGLNIVKRLVEMHDGSIVAESGGPGMGSTFTVRLPVALSVAEAKSDDPSNNDKTQPAAHRRILIVDDNRSVASSLAMLLELMGHDTQTASDGLEAVAASETFEPDIILMDIGMPKLNGYEACSRIRGEAWGREVIIVAITGWGQEDDKRRSHNAGFDFHLVKPLDPRALKKILDYSEQRGDLKEDLRKLNVEQNRFGNS